MNGRPWLVQLTTIILAAAITSSACAEPYKIFSGGPTGIPPPPKVPIILDLDLDSDCDDAAAIAVLHCLEDNGIVNILGMMISAGNEWSAPCAHAINTWFGKPDIPVGVPLKPGPIVQESKYAKGISQQWPHDTPEPEKRPKATVLYRKILAGEKDHSVTIVSIGDLTNLAQLLETKPDEFSDLSGRELVEQKVAHWVCMGSRYPADLDPAKWGNFKMDPESTVQAIEAWPTPITFTGGGKFAESLATGARLSEAAADNPVRRAYELYFGGQTKNRHSADQIAVLVGYLVSIKDGNDVFQITRGGHNHIFPDGRHEWRTDVDNPRQQYVNALQKRTDDNSDARSLASVIDQMMLHEPPRRSK